MLKILIIEDEIELLNNLASYLRSYDKEFEVLTAPSGEEGLAVLESNPGVNLLLTDVRLPGIDGIEVVRRTVEQWSDVKIVVMTAFGSAEMRNTAENEGALKFIEKPVDLDSLPETLRQVHESRQRRSRAVGGLDILDVAQFVAMARETKVIRFQNEHGQGTLVFENGVIVYCSTGKFEGAEAFFDMALWGEGSFCELFDVETRRYSKNVDVSTTELLNQAIHLCEVIDDDGIDLGSSPSSEQPNAKHAPPNEQFLSSGADDVSGKPGSEPGEDLAKGKIKEYLQPIAELRGFMGVTVFSKGGKMLESVETGEIDTQSIATFANNVLANAQKATDEMGVGMGNFVMIEAPRATILVQCLDGVTDPSKPPGEEDPYCTVVILEAKSNVGMAKLVLENVVGKISDSLHEK